MATVARLGPRFRTVRETPQPEDARRHRPAPTATTTPGIALSTTGTSLDWIVDTLATDAGLAANIPAAQIAAGLQAADGLNRSIAEGIAALRLLDDGRIGVADVAALNGWIRSDAGRPALSTALPGETRTGVETGYHLIKDDGGTSSYLGFNLVDTLADGLYRIGFAVQDDHFLNEDGKANASIGEVATWLNHLLLNTADGEGSAGRGVLNRTGAAAVEQAGAGDDSIPGGVGADTILGEAGNDYADGEAGDDSLEDGIGDDPPFGAGRGDTVASGENWVWLFGGEGNDPILGGGAARAVGEILVLGDAIAVDGAVHGAQAGGAPDAGFDAYAQAWTQPGGWAFG
ncbi:calcium-binding protein [Dankookia sp. GCM10030260]|uniref:calcium-binding protein n=1 Tax=Dankookia sp. GCM10030260 TaxID=3273390 RepID=UPI003607EFD4